jgi:alpha-galactosidase
MHGKIWINDPDCLIVRDGKEVLKYQERTALTLQETYMLASAMIMSGGAIFLGDRMELLSQKRINIIKKVFALRSNTTALPLDRMEKALPQIWLRKGDGNSVDPHLLAVFNFDKEPVLHRISLLDLALNTGVDYQVNDIWAKQPGLSLNDAIEVRLEPHTCKLLSIHKDPA